MLDNPQLSNVQHRWLTEGGREKRRRERATEHVKKRATLQKDCMLVCTRGKTLRDDWYTEIAQPIRGMTGK